MKEAEYTQHKHRNNHINRRIALLVCCCAVIASLAGCAKGAEKNSITPEQLRQVVQDIETIASCRFTGDTDEVKAALTNSFNTDTVEAITKLNELAYTDEFIPLESYIKDIYTSMLEDQTMGFIPNGDGTYMSMWDEGNPDATYEETHIHLDIKNPEELGELDSRIEEVGGVRGIYSSKIPSDSEGKADVVIYGKVVSVDVGTKTSLQYLIGDRNYNFSAESYNYFDNNTLLVKLKTKDYAPNMIAVENGDSDPAEIPDGEVTEYFTIIVKGTLDPTTIKFTPTDNSLKLLTEPIEVHR